MAMRNEKQVRELYDGMKEHAKYITDNLQREGYLNFMSALEWVLMDNAVTDAQIMAAAKDLGLTVGFVELK